MACVNCGASSDYLVADPGAEALEFCGMHLPPHMVDRANAGHFPLVPQLPSPPAEEAEEEEEDA